jgi:hypothetical protein
LQRCNAARKALGARVEWKAWHQVEAASLFGPTRQGAGHPTYRRGRSIRGLKRDICRLENTCVGRETVAGKEGVIDTPNKKQDSGRGGEENRRSGVLAGLNQQPPKHARCAAAGG